MTGLSHNYTLLHMRLNWLSHQFTTITINILSLHWIFPREPHTASSPSFFFLRLIKNRIIGINGTRFYEPDNIPVTKPTVSKHCREHCVIHRYDVIQKDWPLIKSLKDREHNKHYCVAQITSRHLLCKSIQHSCWYASCVSSHYILRCFRQLPVIFVSENAKSRVKQSQHYDIITSHCIRVQYTTKWWHCKCITHNNQSQCKKR